MPRPHRPTPELPAHMAELYRRFPFDRSLAQDPLSCVRPYRDEPAAAEVAGLFAATLAIGTTTSIRHAFTRWQEAIGTDLLTYVDRAPSRGIPVGLRTFRHRWIRGDQLHFLAQTVGDIRSDEGSIENVFMEGFREGGFAGGLDGLARRLRAGPGSTEAPPPGYARLFPSPLDDGRSPCKRAALFVRWMVRTDYPDLGVWHQVPVAALQVPLDHHVFWIAYHLGLTQRKTRGWAAVEDVTQALQRIDPNDPIKYDFVLCHTGISGDCPKTRDITVCGPCVVRPDCLLWRRAPRAGG
ncbi:MAG: DUF2400 family protein [Thermoplasmata archaeon]